MNIENASSVETKLDTTGSKELSQEEIKTMFDDQFFEDLNNGNIIKEEINGKVYFEKPNTTDKYGIRQLGSTIDQNFVDKFFVSKEDWANAQNEYNLRHGIQNTVQQATTAITGLNTDVTAHQVPENMSESMNIQMELDNLLIQYESLKDGLKGAESNGETKRNLKHQINENIESIKRIQRDLEKHPDYNNLSVYQERVAYLKYFLDNYESARQIITLGGQTSDVPAIIDSVQDARREKKAQGKEHEQQKKINKLLRTDAMYSLMNGDNEAYEEYLEDVTNRMIEPSTHPFYTQHKQSFMLIEQANPDLYQDLYPTGGNRIPYAVYCQRQNIPTGVARYNKCDNFATKMGKDFSNMLESFGLNKENDPRKKEAWNKIGSLAAVGGAIFLGFKTLQSLFSKKPEGKRGKVAGYGAGLFALLNYDKILGTLGDATGIHPLEKQRATDELLAHGYNENDAYKLANYYSEPVLYTLNTMQYLPTRTFLDQNIIQNGSNGLIFNYQAYEAAINALAATDPTRYTEQDKRKLLENAKKLSENETLFRSGLGALGLTSMAAFSSIQHQEQPITQALNVSDNYVNYLESLTSGIGADLAKEGLKAKPEKIVEMSTQYNAPENENRKDELIKEWIINGYVDLLANDKNYTLDDMVNNQNIDLGKKTMKGFTNAGGSEISFDSYEELFDVAHLTDWIKENFKGRAAISERPFHMAEGEPGRIEFDDVEWYKIWKNETDVLKARTIKKTSSLLGKNRENYVNYLNNWWVTEGIGQKIDISNYAIIKNLGINFYNEAEAVKVEKWLSEIKNELAARTAQNGTKPFKYSTLGTDLIFVASGNSEEKIKDNINSIQTIKDNKEKVLDFLNNTENKMRGSALD